MDDTERLNALESVGYVWLRQYWSKTGPQWSMAGATTQADGYPSLRDCIDAWIEARERVAQTTASQ